MQKLAPVLQGFRAAIASVAQKQTSTAAFTAIPAYESSIWANNMLQSLWRVRADAGGGGGGYAPKYALNEYARRAMAEGGGKQGALPYGGLEPYLSNTMSSILASTLKAFEPESGAYLSLHR